MRRVERQGGGSKGRSRDEQGMGRREEDGLLGKQDLNGRRAESVQLQPPPIGVSVQVDQNVRLLELMRNTMVERKAQEMGMGSERG